MATKRKGARMQSERKQETVPVAFRLELGLLERLDAYAEKLADELGPGVEVTRVIAVRRLLERALEREGLGAKAARRRRTP